MSASAEVLQEDNDDAPYEASTTGAPVDGDDNYCCVSEQVYVEGGNEKKVLYLLCIGLMHRNHNNEERRREGCGVGLVIPVSATCECNRSRGSGVPFILER
jgi:hypothetical protein